jgi:hypothetical protein
MVISTITTSKNYIELLVPVRSETGFVIRSKFWSRNDLRHHRNFEKKLSGHQGCLSKQTVIQWCLGVEESLIEMLIVMMQHHVYNLASRCTHVTHTTVTLSKLFDRSFLLT